MTALNKELAPCPFCGSHSLDPAKQGKRYVSCNDCGCFGPGQEQKGILGAMTQWAIAEAEINDGWNRRASTPSALPVEGAGWQPIETAPKDESVLIAASPDWVFEARQDLNDVAGEQVWQWVKPDGTPLHANLIPLRWQPMPTFPDSVPEQAAGRRLTDAEREAIYNAWQDDDLILWDAYAEGRKDEAEARPYGPDNPPPLRRDGESVKDYRIRCGWDKPAKEVARTEDCPATCWIEVVQGSTGPALCIGDDSGSHRLAGPKTGGGGTTTHRFRVRIDELVREAKALAARGVEE